MTCAEAEPLIGASLDGELDAQTALQIENHVSECATCSAVLDRMERLRDEISAAELDWSAHVDLRRLAATIRRSRDDPWWKRQWLWRSALAAVAAALIVMVYIPARPGRSLEQQMVDNHLRSLLADHLVDVPSTDRHTVKPWFQGKLNFSPPVPELTAQGFTLVGGRLDVVSGSPAAAIVYKRRQHVVNLWISPSQGDDFGMQSASVGGFNLVQWRRDRMVYCAISDLNAVELREFADLIRSR